MIEQFLNIKNSTRNLSDNEFNEILPQLANELKDIPIEHTHAVEILMADYDKLKQWNLVGKLYSRSRVGLKLCDHFFPNIYDVKSKGKSFRECWNDVNLLKKILKWNRKVHSTPYMSELKRGVYFCGGSHKITMFRPQLAKHIVSKYDANVILDPCAGWGGRMLGTVAAGSQYIGFEPNTETYDNLVKLSEFLGIQNQVTLFHDGIENVENYDFKPVDLILTSPPYFNLEVYSDEITQSHVGYETYDEWKYGFLIPMIVQCGRRLKSNGISCWNVHNIGKMKLMEDVNSIHNGLGFVTHHTFRLNHPTRPRHATDEVNFHKIKSSGDLTIAYIREGHVV